MSPSGMRQSEFLDADFNESKLDCDDDSGWCISTKCCCFRVPTTRIAGVIANATSVSGGDR
jgi:hypothetical protein